MSEASFSGYFVNLLTGNVIEFVLLPAQCRFSVSC